MLKKEFEKLTGIYPSNALYRCIEAKYMEMPMVRKENFCNYYKNNTDGIAELIQMLADEDEIARDEKHKEQKTLLKKEIDSLKEQLKIINRKLELEEEWKEYVDKRYITDSAYQTIQQDCSFQFLTEDDAKTYIHEEFGFVLENIKIISKMPVQQKNRHGVIRDMKDKYYDRRPVYFATDLNYVAFECCGYAYECINGELQLC